MAECSVWDHLDNLKLDLALDPEDPRWVPLNHARGQFNEARILRELGVDERSQTLRHIPDRRCVLFGAHRGCGKSTELRRLSQQLNGDGRYCVIFVDALTDLDINSLRYSDMLLALAQTLIARLEQENLNIDPVFLARLEGWFNERIESHESTRELAAQVKAGAETQTGLPWLGRLFAGLQSAVRINSTYKDEVRAVARNTFMELTDAFNTLLAPEDYVELAQIDQAGAELTPVSERTRALL